VIRTCNPAECTLAQGLKIKRETFQKIENGSLEKQEYDPLAAV
jgi:DNA-binding XRE family transcriptional regulator